MARIPRMLLKPFPDHIEVPEIPYMDGERLIRHVVKAFQEDYPDAFAFDPSWPRKHEAVEWALSEWLEARAERKGDPDAP